MNNDIVIDACAIFAFFQYQKPNSLTNLNLSPQIKEIFFRFLINQVRFHIPIPSMAEFMFKMNKNDQIEEFTSFLKEIRKMENVFFLNWDIEVLEDMSFFLNSNYNDIKLYFSSIKKSIEIFDLAIFRISICNGYNTIISKDKIFDDLYNMIRIW